jgi:hypothetical protein
MNNPGQPGLDGVDHGGPAVEVIRGWIFEGKVNPNAEGVKLQSLGSAMPQRGGAPPWETFPTNSITPKAFNTTIFWAVCPFFYRAFGGRVV